jgi:hypothetical protein
MVHIMLDTHGARTGERTGMPIFVHVVLSHERSDDQLVVLLAGP